MAWRIKQESNDSQRQRFVDQTAPQAEFLKLAPPDPELRRNPETGHYTFGEIDWSEFHAVLAGNGPCNRERMAARRKAHDDGQWFRDGLMAHAQKRRSARVAAE
jgi:ring-1,2-phenylacetyl-CoA epoxidase subunit PaaA